MGMSQSKFCDYLGIGVGSLKKCEVGDSEPSFGVMEKIANHPEVGKYTIWLLTGNTIPEAGQVSPATEAPNIDKNKQQVTPRPPMSEQDFVDKVTDSLMMYHYFDWIKINKEKIDFEAAGKYMLKQVGPLVGAKSSMEKMLDKTGNE